MIYLKDDPIIALSSGTGHSAIGLIRLSSPNPFPFFNEVFSFQITPSPREAIFCQLLDNGKVLDEIILNYFPAPKSYTGEFVLELSVHGNPVNIARILKFFQEKHSFRLAEPGEFSYRALKNGKLTLSQIEGLDLLLNATSKFGIESGLAALQGDLHKKFIFLRDSFIALKAAIELSIDFLEDVGEESAHQNFEKCLNRFEFQLKELHELCQKSSTALLTPTIVLVGKSNVGKSTLFNKFLKMERSLVDGEEGTTRDYISEDLLVKGISFRLIDTAGIRETKNRIEEKGIVRSLELLKKAFYRLYVCNPFEEEELNRDWFLKVKMDGLVFTHADCQGFQEQLEKVKIPLNLDTYISFGSIGPSGSTKLEKWSDPMGPVQLNDFEEKSGSMGPTKLSSLAEKSGPMGPTRPSSLAEKGGPMGPGWRGIDSFFPDIVGRYEKQTVNQFLIAERQISKINSLNNKMEQFRQVQKEIHDIGVWANEINLFAREIDELLGIITPDEVLDKIFSNFCIGK